MPKQVEATEYGFFMLSKRYESTEIDRRTWLHVSSLSGPSAVTLAK